MFLFGLLEFLFTLLVCFNVQATCNKGKIWYKNVSASILLFPISHASKVLHLLRLCFQVFLTEVSIIV